MPSFGIPTNQEELEEGFEEEEHVGDQEDEEEDEQQDKQPVATSDIQDFVNNITSLESVHKIIPNYPDVKGKKSAKTKKSQRLLLSLRVVQTAVDPITSSTTSLTTSNLTFSLAAGADGKAKHSATLPSLSIPQSLNTLSLLSNISSGKHKNSKNLPKLLLTFTNGTDDFYEVELTYAELCGHRKEVSLDSLNWKQYISYLHNALISPQSEENLVLQFDDEERDILKATIYAPLPNTNSTTNAIKLKYTYEMYAVRDNTERTSKISSLFFDLADYSNQLFNKRAFEDKPAILQLQKEVKTLRDKLSQYEDRLNLFQPAGSGSLMESPAKKQKTKVLGIKRKARSLVNPTQKKQTKPKGVKIGKSPEKSKEGS